MKKLLILIIILALIGCQDSKLKSQENTELLHNNELHYALWSAPSGVFAPQYETSDYDGIVLELAYESLVKVNPSNEFEGILAESWLLSEDSKSITFHLRKDVEWHDGEAFTAEDVAFSIHYIADADYTGNMYYLVAAIQGIEAYKAGETPNISGIEILDPYTIRISTTEVYAPIIEQIGGLKIFPKHIWNLVDIGTARDNKDLMQATIGTGPYMIDHVELDRKITMKSNPNYWAGKANIDYFSFEVMNTDIAKVKMINGELDFMQITTMEEHEIKLYEDAGLEIQEVDYNSFQSVIINTRNPVLEDVTIRKAMARAIDRELMVETLLFGHGAVANTVYREEHFAYPENHAIDSYVYDPERAIRDLIHKANLKYQNKLLYKNNEPIKLRLIYPSGNKARELSAPIIQENLLNIGIQSELIKVEFSELVDALETGDFDLALIGSGFDLDPDVSRVFSSDYINLSNYSQFRNEELDTLLKEGVKHLDENKRAEIYKEVAILLNDQLPMIFLYHWSEGRVLSNRLKGVTCYPYNYFYNVHKWYLEE